MKKKSRIILLISISVIAICVISILTIKTIIENDLQVLASAEVKNVDLSQVPDGVFRGQYSALPVSADVEVSVQGSRIKAIKIITHNNGQGKPAEIIIDQVIEKQSLEVDVISGATYSSKVILKSIEDALLKASSGEQ